MANEKFTQLPTVPSSQLSDIIAAVQAGISVQQTLGQVSTLLQNTLIQHYAGNPNGNVSGTVYGLCWDTSNQIMYVCTTSGNAATAVWTVAGSLPIPVTVPSGGTGLTTTTAYGLITGGTTATGNFQNAGTGTSGQIYVSGGAAALGTWTSSTGTGNIARATSPVFVTPTLGAATATSLAFNPTTGGIVGTTNADNVTAGDVGEVISSYQSPTSIATGTPTNLTSIILTAGDWDLYTITSVVPANTRLISLFYAGASTTSATLPSGNFAFTSWLGSFTGDGSSAITITASSRINIASTTTVYVVVQHNTAVSASNCFGGAWARRAR